MASETDQSLNEFLSSLQQAADAVREEIAALEALFDQLMKAKPDARANV